MLSSVTRQLRRHRRSALTVLAVFALASVALTAHSALMRSDTADHMSAAAAVCVIAGGCIAVIGVAVFAVRRLARRPLWSMPAPIPPALAFVPAPAGFPARAGPPPVLQVFRL